MRGCVGGWREKKLVEEQGGFRAERSTTEQIFILKEILRFQNMLDVVGEFCGKFRIRFQRKE